MTRVLVTYATRTGATTDVAGMLADELRALGHDVEVRPVASRPSPQGYDLVVIGSGVRMRRLYHEVPEWIDEHESELAAIPVGVFDVSLSPVVDPEDGRRRADEVIERMLERFPALRPVAVAAFPGAFRPDSLSLPEQELVRLMGAEPGDYTDEAEVRAWARTLSALAPQPQPASR